MLTDISYEGARVEQCSWVPPIGALLLLYLDVPGLEGVELSGSVLRGTESSFALEYEVDEPSRCEEVDRITALLFAAATDAHPG